MAVYVPLNNRFFNSSFLEFSRLLSGKQDRIQLEWNGKEPWIGYDYLNLVGSHPADNDGGENLGYNATRDDKLSLVASISNSAVVFCHC